MTLGRVLCGLVCAFALSPSQKLLCLGLVACRTYKATTNASIPRQNNKEKHNNRIAQKVSLTPLLGTSTRRRLGTWLGTRQLPRSLSASLVKTTPLSHHNLIACYPPHPPLQQAHSHARLCAEEHASLHCLHLISFSLPSTHKHSPTPVPYSRPLPSPTYSAQP